MRIYTVADLTVSHLLGVDSEKRIGLLCWVAIFSSEPALLKWTSAKAEQFSAVSSMLSSSFPPDFCLKRTMQQTEETHNVLLWSDANEQEESVPNLMYKLHIDKFCRSGGCVFVYIHTRHVYVNKRRGWWK